MRPSTYPRRRRRPTRRRGRAAGVLATSTTPGRARRAASVSTRAAASSRTAAGGVDASDTPRASVPARLPSRRARSRPTLSHLLRRAGPRNATFVQRFLRAPLLTTPSADWGWRCGCGGSGALLSEILRVRVSVRILRAVSTQVSGRSSLNLTRSGYARPFRYKSRAATLPTTPRGKASPLRAP